MQGNSLFASRFVLLHEVASPGGMSGGVYKALDIESRLDCALKRFPSQQDPLGRLAVEREVDALTRLVHPNVVRMLGWGREESSNETWIAEEWLSEDLAVKCAKEPFSSHGDFYTRLGGPILDALSVAHARGILHRDIKPQNIMFGSNGEPKLIDFGISGRTNQVGIGRTLQDFKTVPFSPPESGLGSPFDETRDVFGFAAVMVYSLTGGGKLETYEELQSRFKKLSLPSEIGDLVGSCLATDPEDRPQNIVIARAAFDRLSATAKVARAPTSSQKIGLTLSPSTLAHARRQMGADEDLKSICELLNADTVFELGMANDGAIRATTSDFTFKLVRDNRNNSCLFVAGVFETRPAHWAQLVTGGFRMPVEFVAIDGNAVVNGGSQAIELLLQSVEEYQALMASSKRSVIDAWRTILRGRIDIARALHPKLIADVVRRVGSRLFLRTEHDIEGMEGLHYLVGDGVEKFASGEIERASEGLLTLYSSAELPSKLPSRVVLTFNSIGTEASIRREEKAINLIQDGDIPLPQLKGLLEDPSATRPPIPVAIDTILPKLDDDKKLAVEAALGSTEVLLVIGPPGTGKTQFIAELILQELKRNPSARILLAAQTHIAVDNALTRVRDASGTLRCVRVGAVGDDRISESSRKLLLDSSVIEWVKRVTDSSTAAVRQRCEGSGFDYDALIGTVKRRQLEERSADRDRIAAKVEYTTQKIDLVAANVDEAPEAPWRTELTRLQHELINEKELLRIANLSVEESEMAVARIPFKHPPGPNVESDAEMEARTLRIVELHEHWVARLANPSDHYPAVLMDASVVAGTCVGFVGAKGAAQLAFDLAIVDEASRAAPTEVLVAASRASRIVLVGDRKQLPAYLERGLLDSDWLDSCGLSKSEVRETLFERFEVFLPSQNVKRLQMQYRMIRAIGSLVEKCFYPGQLGHPLQDDAFDVSLTGAGLPRNVILLSTSAADSKREEKNGTGFENSSEVALCERILRRLLSKEDVFTRRPSIVILTPYVAQQKLLRRAVDQVVAEHPGAAVEVHTVHGFQGREADFAVVSLVRSNSSGEMGFVNDDQLINVALSRGKAGLVLIGDVAFLSKQPADSAIGRVVGHIRSHPQECAILGLRS